MIRTDMTILDILCDHQETQEVFRRYDDVIGECVMCNHMTGLANPDYRQLKLAAGAIARAWEESMPSQSPILILLERDMAKALGFAFQGQTHRPVLALDDIVVKEGDYIDLGQPVVENLAVPVVVKTLIFG